MLFQYYFETYCDERIDKILPGSLFGKSSFFCELDNSSRSSGIGLFYIFGF